MVSLDPPAHGRLRKPAARAFTPRRVDEMAPRIRATCAELLDAVDAARPLRSRRGARVPAADADHVQLHGRAGAGLAAAEGVVRQPREPGLGTADADEEALHHAQQMVALPALPARARGGQGRRPRRRLRERAAGDPRRGPVGAVARGGRLDPVLPLVRRARDHQQPDRQLRPAAAGGAGALGAAGRRTGADRRRGGRDAALRPFGAGVA